MRKAKALSSVARKTTVRTIAAPVLVFLVTMVAFLLRFHQLGTRSLWVDEAMSVVFAAKPIPELFHLLVTEDIHPPLYPLLLHFWMMVFGNSEQSVRFPSVVFGVLLIPLIYVTGRRLEQLEDPNQRLAVSPVGLVGAVIATTSVYYIAYSQEARNYMAVTLMGLLSSYLLLGALQGKRRRDWVAYGVATAGAVYTHYTAFLLLPFHFLFVMLWGKDRRRGWRSWAVSMAGVGIVYLPWAGYSLSQMQRISDYWSGVLQLDAALRTSLLVFVAGGDVGTRISQLPLVLGLGLLAIGLFALVLGPLRRKSSQPTLFLLLYLVVPSTILFAVAYYRPKFDPRYLLVVTPAFYLILAWGIALLFRPMLSRSLPAVPRVLLTVLGISALTGTIAISNVYGDPGELMHVGDGAGAVQQYGDYRALVAYLDSHSEPGDAVMLMMNAYHPYVYYSKKNIPWYPMEPFDDFDGAIIRLNRLVDLHYRRIWFILWQPQWADPANYVMQVMDSQAIEIPVNASFGGIGLRLFHLVPGQRFNYYPKVAHKVDAVFGDGLLEFWGWNLSSTTVAPGDSIQFDLHWILHKPTTAKMKTKVMLMDSSLHQYAVVDEIMGTPYYPTYRWKTDQITPDEHTLKIPPGTPPGTYDAQLLVYDEHTMTDQPIQKWSGQKLGTTLLSLGKITVISIPHS